MQQVSATCTEAALVVWNRSSAPSPVIASMRRTPAEMLPS